MSSSRGSSVSWLALRVRFASATRALPGTVGPCVSCGVSAYTNALDPETLPEPSTARIMNR